MRRRTRHKKGAIRAGVGAQAALGFRSHSGWAVLVAVAGPASSPAVIERRRIEIADPAIAGSKQPYHAAEGWPLKKAEEYLNRCTRTSNLLARRAVRAVVRDLQKRGYDVAGCGVLLASGRPITTLEATLASHALIHTAEGELFRNALIQACERYELPVAKVKERELFACGATKLGISEANLHSRIAELGRPIGPPWSQDEKYAALVGWLALAATTRRPGRRSRRKK